MKRILVCVLLVGLAAAATWRRTTYVCDRTGAFKTTTRVFGLPVATAASETEVSDWVFANFGPTERRDWQPTHLQTLFGTRRAAPALVSLDLYRRFHQSVTNQEMRQLVGAALLGTNAAARAQALRALP